MKVIVGIDPGLTTGIAIFDLSGNLINLYSKKGMGKAEIVKYILSFGTPIIITTDKKMAPKMLEEISSALSSIVFAPKEDLSVKLKKELTEKFSPKNTHERDALASGLYFFKKHKRKLNEIDRVLEEMNLSNYSDKIKELILTGKAKNLTAAIETIFGEQQGKELIKERKKEKKRVQISKEDECREKLARLERSYEISKEYIEKLEKRIKELEEQKKLLMDERLNESREIREKVMRDKEIEFRENIIKNLRKELEMERTMRKQLEEKLKMLDEERYLAANNLEPIIKIKQFNRESILQAKETFRIYNKGVIFESTCKGTTTAKYLVSLRPKFVIGEFGKEEKKIIEENGIPVISRKEIEEDLVELNNFYGIDKNLLSEILKTEKKKSFLEWLDDYKKRFL